MRSLLPRPCQPSPDQELLLDAVLLSGDRTVDAWKKWKRRNEIDHVGGPEFQVLPLLYWNLTHEGIDDPQVERLKGIYRMAWSKNQWLLSRALPVLRTLHRQGIAMMLLKGAALNALYGEKKGIRLVGDVDVLVHRRDAWRAAHTVTTLGWTPKHPRLRLTMDYVSLSKAVDFIESSGGNLDLHWALFPEDLVEAHEEPVWRHGISLPTAGVPTLVPDPTELLLHVCIHGWAWSPDPAIRWVLDAMTILRESGADIDWSRLIEDAGRRRLTPRLEAALSYLRARFEGEVPDRFMEQLRGMPVSRWDRYEYRLRTQPMRTPVGGLVLHALRFRRLRDESYLQSGLWGFAEYFRRQWALRHIGQVPLWMAGKLARRLWKFILRLTSGHPACSRGANRAARAVRK